jgi:biopolymer transport protein ExbD
MQVGGGESESGASHAAATYRGLRSRRTSAALGEINVTPLVDVVLVLLLVFMVTAPMMTRGIDVSLPVANQPQIPQEDRITVTVDAEGRTYVNSKAVHMQLLQQQIKDIMQGRPQKVVYLRADQGLRYGRVIEVVDQLKQAGVDQIGFAYELPRDKSK